VAVDEHCAAVAGLDRRPEQRAHDVQELRILGRVDVLDAVLDLLLAAARVDRDQRHHERDDARDHDRHDQGLAAEATSERGGLHDLRVPGWLGNERAKRSGPQGASSWRLAFNSLAVEYRVARKGWFVVYVM